MARRGYRAGSHIVVKNTEEARRLQVSQLRDAFTDDIVRTADDIIADNVSRFTNLDEIRALRDDLDDALTVANGLEDAETVPELAKVVRGNFPVPVIRKLGGSVLLKKV